MALAFTNTTIEVREISLRNRPKELYGVSSKGTVPVLITLDNLVIDESLKIMLWALTNYSNQTWLSKNSSKELEMIKINDIVFKKWLDKYKYHDRYPEESKEFYRDKCIPILNSYEIQLNNKKYLLSNQINIVDIAIFPFIRQFSNIDYLWFEKKYKNLEYWLEKFSTSNLFNSVMKKYDLWSEKRNKLIINFNDQ